MTNKRVNKKERELRYLNRFRALCDDFPNGGLQSHEEPDFLITDDVCIGIEITELYVDRPKRRNTIKEVEESKNRITKLAERAFLAQDDLPLVYVDLYFNRACPLRRDQEPRIARAVSQTVIRNLPAEGQSVQIEYRLGSCQPIEVDLIGIHRIDDFGSNRWTWHEAGQPIKAAIPYIQSIVEGKDTKLPKYLKKCAKCWLLIVAPSWTPAGMIHPDIASLEHIYQSRFSRTYFLNDSFDALARLNTIPVVSSSSGRNIF